MLRSVVAKVLGHSQSASTSTVTSLAVFVSGHGRGSNFQAIVDGCARENFPAQVAVLVSLNPEAGAVERAHKHNIPVEIIDPKSFASPEELDAEIVRRLRQFEVGLVCNAGYLRLLTPVLIREYPNRIMNIHPALLPAFGGMGMYGRRVHEAVIASGTKVSGATVHFVDGEYDHGPIILQKTVPVEDDDTPETLAARVLTVEHEIYPQSIELFAQDRLRVEGRRVIILPHTKEATT